MPACVLHHEDNSDSMAFTLEVKAELKLNELIMVLSSTIVFKQNFGR
jgi:hypothetical protein